MVWNYSIATAPAHNDVIKWRRVPRHWPFVPGIHRSPTYSPHKGQWRGALMFSLICAWINGWVDNREVGDSSRHRAHYDVIVVVRSMWYKGNAYHLLLCEPEIFRVNRLINVYVDAEAPYVGLTSVVVNLTMSDRQTFHKRLQSYCHFSVEQIYQSSKF